MYINAPAGNLYLLNFKFIVNAPSDSFAVAFANAGYYLWGANVLGDYKMCAEFLKVRNIPIVYPEIIQAAGERFHYHRDNKQK